MAFYCRTLFTFLLSVYSIKFDNIMQGFVSMLNWVVGM